MEWHMGERKMLCNYAKLWNYYLTSLFTSFFTCGQVPIISPQLSDSRRVVCVTEPVQKMVYLGNYYLNKGNFSLTWSYWTIPDGKPAEIEKNSFIIIEVKLFEIGSSIHEVGWCNAEWCYSALEGGNGAGKGGVGVRFVGGFCGQWSVFHISYEIC